MSRSISLSVSPFKPRNCWRKVINGKQHYFRHPINKAGEQAALKELAEYLKQLDTERPNARLFQHHRTTFESVLKWWELYGTAVQGNVVALPELRNAKR